MKLTRDRIIGFAMIALLVISVFVFNVMEHGWIVTIAAHVLTGGLCFYVYAATALILDRRNS